jgi:hypothetical protein
MSGLGQTRRFRDVRGMSGLPQTADISGLGRHFAFVPKAELSCLELRHIQSMKDCGGLGLWTRDDTAAPVA